MRIKLWLPKTHEPTRNIETSYSGRDLSNLLWGDLKTDDERLEFIRCGRAVSTGIIAPAIVDDLIAAYEKACKCKQV